MINLLPSQNKKELLQEENWKIIMILGIDILVILVCFSLILYSINIFISGEINFQKIIYEQREKEFEIPQMQTLQQGLITFNKTLSQLDSFYQSRFKATEILEEISEIIPSGIYLTNLSINPKTVKEKEIEYTLAGFSPTRENLLLFKENLEKKETFEEVYFSPANWLKPIDINFTVNFKIKWPFD